MRWLGFCFIALAVLFFYLPSLLFPPRADQVIYLSETATIQKPLDLIFGSYDHNRHRTIAPGDELLFRPLLYVLLGTEQVILGHHFWAWQLFGILAHLTLVWMLLRLLWHVCDPWLAFAGAWVFALSVFNYELVTWTHLSGYILMMACIVGVIEQAVLCIEDSDVAWRRLGRLLMYSFVACFFYETANVFVLMITGLLIFSFPQRARRLLVLTVPVFLYGLCSYLNYVCAGHTNTHPSAAVAHGTSAGQYVWAVLYTACWWFYEGLFNGMYHYVLGIRTMFRADEVMVFKTLVFNDLQVLMALIMLVCFLGLAWISRRQFIKKMGLLTALGGMLFSYAAVIVIGRFHDSRDLFNTVRINTYYSYIFWVIIVIAAFLLVSRGQVKTSWQRWLIIVFVAASVVSGLSQGVTVYGMADHYGKAAHASVSLVEGMDYLVQTKSTDLQFSFYVDPSVRGNYSYGLSDGIRKLTDPPDKQYSFIELLYPQYFRPRQSAEFKFPTENSS